MSTHTQEETLSHDLESSKTQKCLSARERFWAESQPASEESRGDWLKSVVGSTAPPAFEKNTVEKCFKILPVN